MTSVRTAEPAAVDLMRLVTVVSFSMRSACETENSFDRVSPSRSARRKVLRKFPITEPPPGSWTSGSCIAQATFGMPPLTGMLAGTPVARVIASKTSSAVRRRAKWRAK